MNPMIGVIPLYDETLSSYWMLPGYMQALEQCGALPVMLPLTAASETLDAAITRCQGFLLTGGHDVEPGLYGQARKPFCGNSCPTRDRMEYYILSQAAALDIPVLGICRGLQIMNVHTGGTLYQDLPSELPGSLPHCMTPPYDRAAHTVSVLPGTPLARIISSGEHAVNSYHHQGIARLSPRLQAMAHSPDGLIEAAFLPGKRFFMGVQWHPEYLYHCDSGNFRLFKAFAAACAEI